MVVGEDVAVLREDDAGTRAGLRVFAGAAARVAVAVAKARHAEDAAERIVVIVVVIVVVDHGRLRLDGDDAGTALFRNLRDGEGVLIGGSLHNGEMLLSIFCLAHGGQTDAGGQRERSGEGEDFLKAGNVKH